MTRKKSNPWLNKPKRVALAKRGNLVTPLKSTLTPKQNLVHETQRQNGNEFFPLILSHAHHLKLPLENHDAQNYTTL